LRKHFNIYKSVTHIFIVILLPIPESQLDTWSTEGASVTAKTTYDSVKKTLETSLSSVDFETYLQGSYRNSTNIRADSDVDVVVELKSAFTSNKSELSQDDRGLYDRTYSDATYTLAQFRNDVFGALVNHYGGGSVSVGNKSLKVVKGSGRLGADLVVCVEYRKYRSFSGAGTSYMGGIAIWDARGSRWVVNYPKLHYDNGVTKNSQTHDWYKPTVRMFKNARSYLMDNNTITENLAPSYFLECMLYNVPNSNFGVSFHQTYYAIMKWLNATDITRLVCQNEQLPLVGSTPEQWSTASINGTIHELTNVWNNWR
jgi:hypothetical protein